MEDDKLKKAIEALEVTISNAENTAEKYYSSDKMKGYPEGQKDTLAFLKWLDRKEN